MPQNPWPATYKRPALAASGMVTSNHPLASLAGNAMLARGGNAVDAAIATMFALSVVEPMMVTIFGAGFVNIRLADGTSTVFDNYCTVPKAATPDMFEPIPGANDHRVKDGLNETGHLSVATGGTLLGWAEAVRKYGNLSLAEVIFPSIGLARHGFRVSPFLRWMTEAFEAEIRRYPETAKVFLPKGELPPIGSTIVRTDYSNTLEIIARLGPDHLYHGPLGKAIADDMADHGGIITMEDIESYQVFERTPVRGTYRDRYEIIGPPPPSSGPLHIIQMLKIFEGMDIAGMGFGTPDAVHTLSETMKIAFADRFEYVADPATTDVPVDWLTSADYAAERRAEIEPSRAKSYGAGSPRTSKGQSTTTCTAIDQWGNVVATTNTLHLGFGSKVTVPGTGMLLNDCMELMDPVPGHRNSIAPGKRVLSSMSPVIVLKDGDPFLALGSVGGLKIFGSVAQAIVNVIDHGMSIQQAVEAPRMFDRGVGLEIESGYPELDALKADLEGRGHAVETVFRSGGGMNGLLRQDDGMFEGAACWRADGAPMGYSGGDALVDPGEMG